MYNGLSNDVILCREIMEVWLRNNEFVFVARTYTWNHRHVFTDLVPEGNVTHNAALIKRLFRYTTHIKMTLKCMGSVWEIFKQFSTLVQLVREFGVFFTVNGAKSQYHIANGPERPRLNITVNRRGTSAQTLLLECLDMGHLARVQQWSANRLETEFNRLVGQRAQRANELRFKHAQAKDIPTVGQVFLGPHDLLYGSKRAANSARHVVDAGEPLDSGFLIRPFVNRVIAGLVLWRQILATHIQALGLNQTGHTLTYGLVFGHYDDVVWALRPAVLTPADFMEHTSRAEVELYRTDAHIAAMQPYA